MSDQNQTVQGGVPIESQEPTPQVVAPFEAPVESTPEPEPTQHPQALNFGVPAEENVITQEPATQEPKKDNDQVRYEYFQSQAAQLTNQLSERDRQVQQLAEQNANMMAMMQNQMAAQTQVQQQAEVPKPPVAPERPEAPAGYNREEALTDPQSESGKYLRQLDSWRDKMDNYNQERLDFERQQIDTERQQMQSAFQQMQMSQQAQTEQLQARQLVEQQYGLSPEHAQRFVEMYARPDSVSMDNLVNLYKMQHQIPLQQTPQVPQTPNHMGVPQQVQIPQVPSQQFQQAEHAQRLGIPMGVQPTAQEATNANYGDKFMNELLANQSDPNKIFGEH